MPFMNADAGGHPSTPLELELEQSVQSYRGLTPQESEALARARIALTISRVSRSGDVMARRTELLFLEVQLAYKLAERKATGGHIAQRVN